MVFDPRLILAPGQPACQYMAGFSGYHEMIVRRLYPTGDLIGST
jgi:hypothetical protein